MKHLIAGLAYLAVIALLIALLIAGALTDEGYVVFFIAALFAILPFFPHKWFGPQTPDRSQKSRQDA
jgi:hypothetical protein